MVYGLTMLLLLLLLFVIVEDDATTYNINILARVGGGVYSISRTHILSLNSHILLCTSQIDTNIRFSSVRSRWVLSRPTRHHVNNHTYNIHNIYINITLCVCVCVCVCIIYAENRKEIKMSYNNKIDWHWQCRSVYTAAERNILLLLCI